MKEYEIFPIKDRFFIILKGEDSLLNYTSEIEADPLIKGKSGEVIVDQFNTTGDESNRFISLPLEEGKLIISKAKQVEKPFFVDQLECYLFPKDYEKILLYDSEKNYNRILLYASEKGDINLCHLALQKGANINTQDKEGWTPIIWATRIIYPETVKFLLANGADINTQTNNGWTALMIAVSNDYREIIKILSLNGADINIKNNEGLSAIMMAEKYSSQTIIDLLRGKQ